MKVQSLVLVHPVQVHTPWTGREESFGSIEGDQNTNMETAAEGVRVRMGKEHFIIPYSNIRRFDPA